jgi:hypothetical protein
MEGKSKPRNKKKGKKIMNLNDKRMGGYCPPTITFA